MSEGYRTSASLRVSLCVAAVHQSASDRLSYTCPLYTAQPSPPRALTPPPRPSTAPYPRVNLYPSLPPVLLLLAATHAPPLPLPSWMCVRHDSSALATPYTHPTPATQTCMQPNHSEAATLTLISTHSPATPCPAAHHSLSDGVRERGGVGERRNPLFYRQTKKHCLKMTRGGDC